MSERYNTLHTRAEVDAAISRIAKDIIRDHESERPLFVALLRGAAPFSSKLLFEVARQAPDMHPEIDYMMVRTYGSATVAHKPQIVTDLAPTTDVTNRPVIIVDDVLDKGITAHFVCEHLKSKGASVPQLAVLVEKQVTRNYPITPDYCGFIAKDEWLVGMGMDDAELCNEGNRWLDEIREIRH